MRSIPGATIHDTKLRCGHTQEFIDSQPYLHDKVFCQRCQDYSVVILGPRH